MIEVIERSRPIVDVAQDLDRGLQISRLGAQPVDLRKLLSRPNVFPVAQI